MDKQVLDNKSGRQWMLQKLYDSGYKYVFRGENYKIYASISRPILIEDKGLAGNIYCQQSDCGVVSKITGAFCTGCFDDVYGYITIATELGIVDWGNIPVDTPIIVEEMDGVYAKRHFAEYKDGYIYYYAYGHSSWTYQSIDHISYKYVTLVNTKDIKQEDTCE